MMKKGESFLARTMAGALGVALLCGVRVARAQDYNSDGDTHVSAYESVIIHPNSDDYGQIELHQLLGHVSGELNPMMLTISEPVNYSDADLWRDSDVNELRLRARDTAINLCSQLAARDINLGDAADTNRECVSQAIQGAIAQLPNRGPKG
jgi:UrcA family protein